MISFPKWAWSAKSEKAAEVRDEMEKLRATLQEQTHRIEKAMAEKSYKTKDDNA